MKNILLSLLICLPFYAGGGALHAFKMSVSEVIYNAQRRGFEVKCYLFQDDLRETLYNDPQNGALSSDKVGPYILRNFDMTINGQTQKLNLQSLRTKDDQVLVEFTAPALPANTSISKVDIRNQLLLDKFSSQVNMVYLYYPDEQHKHTKMFDARKIQAAFEL